MAGFVVIERIRIPMWETRVVVHAAGCSKIDRDLHGDDWKTNTTGNIEDILQWIIREDLVADLDDVTIRDCAKEGASR